MGRRAAAAGGGAAVIIAAVALLTPAGDVGSQRADATGRQVEPQLCPSARQLADRLQTTLSTPGDMKIVTAPLKLPLPVSGQLGQAMARTRMELGTKLVPWEGTRVLLSALLKVLLTEWNSTASTPAGFCSGGVGRLNPFAAAHVLQPEVYQAGRTLQLEPLLKHAHAVVCGSKKCIQRFRLGALQVPCTVVKKMRQNREWAKKVKVVITKDWSRLTNFRQCQTDPLWQAEGLSAAYSILRLQCVRFAADQRRADVNAAPKRLYVDLGARVPPPRGHDDFDWSAELAELLPEQRQPSQLKRYPVKFDEVHAFELSERFVDAWEARVKERADGASGARVFFYHAAATSFDGHVYRRGNEQMDTTTTHHYCKKVACQSVKAVDVARWLREKTKPEDWVVLKIDVEGSEYPLLEHLFNKGVLQSHVDELFVETHDEHRHTELQPRNEFGFAVKDDRHRCPDRTCDLTLFAALRREGVAVHEWV